MPESPAFHFSEEGHLENQLPHLISIIPLKKKKELFTICLDTKR